MADHKSLTRLFTNDKGRAVLGALALALLSTVVTLVKLLTTYDDFRDEAFTAKGSIALLVFLNIVVTGLVIAALVRLIKPPRWFPYAVVVVLSTQVVLAAPIAVSAVTGAEVPGKPENVKLADIYNPLEKWLTDEINEPVKKKKTGEIKSLVDKYEGRGKAGKAALLDRLNESLAAESLSPEEQTKLETEVKEILKMRAPYRQRLRQVAQKLYAGSLRNVVQDLAR